MGEGLGKQAKVLTDRQVKLALAAVSQRRYPERDRAMVLLSVRAGLRAKEIANVTWGMVTDAEGTLAVPFTCRTVQVRARTAGASCR